MKNKFLVILALLIIVSFVFTACAKENGADNGDTMYNESSDRSPQGIMDSENNNDELPTGYCTRSYIPPYEIENFTVEVPYRGGKINFALPDDWSMDGGELLYYNFDASYYSRIMSIEFSYRVADDFILDESIHEKTNKATMINLDEYKVRSRVNNNGLTYILYEFSEEEQYYSGYAYIRVAPQYIMAIRISGDMDHYNEALKVVDSIVME